MVGVVFGGTTYYRFGPVVVVNPATGDLVKNTAVTAVYVAAGSSTAATLLDLTGSALTLTTNAYGVTPAFLCAQLDPVDANFGVVRLPVQCIDLAEKLKGDIATLQASVTAFGVGQAGVYELSAGVGGPVQVGSLVGGGATSRYPAQIGAVVLTLGQPAVGADFIAQFVTRTRTTGATNVRGTFTLIAGRDLRGSLAFDPALTVAASDVLDVICTQVGTSLSGSDVSVSFLGAAAPVPAVLARPAAPTALVAVTAGSNVALTWTTSATGVRSGYFLYRDGAFYLELDRTATSYTDLGEATNAHDYTLRTVNDDAVSTPVSVSFAPTAQITVVGEVGSGRSNASSTTVAVGLTAAVPTGRRLVLALATTGPTSGSTPTTFSATDTAGNTYVLDVSNYLSSGTNQVAILSAPITAALATGDNITITASVALLRMAAVGFHVAGLLVSSPLDQTAVGGSSVATRNFTTGTTAVLAQAKELVVAVFATLAETMTAGGGLSIGTTVVTTAGSNERQVTYEQGVTTTTSAVTATASGSASSAYTAVVATYKAA